MSEKSQAEILLCIQTKLLAHYTGIKNAGCNRSLRGCKIDSQSFTLHFTTTKIVIVI